MNREAIPIPVLAVYGLSPSAVLARLGGTKNANYCAADHHRKLFLRRRHPDYCTPGWLQFDHRALAELARQGAPVLAPVENRQGTTWFVNEGQTYEAFPWISGTRWDEMSKPLGKVIAIVPSVGISVTVVKAMVCLGAAPVA